MCAAGGGDRAMMGSMRCIVHTLRQVCVAGGRDRAMMGSMRYSED